MDHHNMMVGNDLAELLRGQRIVRYDENTDCLVTWNGGLVFHALNAASGRVEAMWTGETEDGRAMTDAEAMASMDEKILVEQGAYLIDNAV